MHPLALPRKLMTAGALIVAVSACAGSEDGAGPPVIDVSIPSTTTSSTTLPELPPLRGLALELVVGGLSEPVAIASVPSIDTTFVVERTGTVRSLTSEGSEVVLDVTDRIYLEVSEQGLLGFTPHPDFPNDPRAFAIYTDLAEDVVVSSFRWDESGSFDPASEVKVLEISQPHYYHQGGGMVFGPGGLLWMGFGDGGGNGDRYKNGQNTDTLKGTIVRISVDGGDPYAIPSTNPFALTDEGAPEIWAYGLRNPWRFAIDGDLLIVADVAYNGSEEVNVAAVDAAGLNYGWPVMEGAECYEAEVCESAGMTPPVLTVGHSGACAIIGGPVYRGLNIPELHGHYIFGDYCFGWMRSAPVVGSSLGEVVDWKPMLGNIGNISTFGTDVNGELLVATLGGDVSRVVARR